MPPAVVRRELALAGLAVPLVELAGSEDGPLLTVLAGVHGCEYASMAAVRRWIRDLATRELRGRVRAVPVLNLSAFAARSPQAARLVLAEAVAAAQRGATVNLHLPASVQNKLVDGPLR